MPALDASVPLTFALAVTGLFTILTLLNAGSSGGGVRSTSFGAAVLLALALTRGYIAADIREGRWPLLFQNPMHPIAHYARRLTRLMATAAVLLGIVVAGGLLGSERIDVRTAVHAWICACAVAAILMSLAAGIGSLVRRYELELILLLIVVSGLQVVLANALALDNALRDLLRWLLIPLDAMAMLMEQFAGSGTGMTTEYWLQLALYPAVWLAIAGWRLHRYHTARSVPL